jgi:hypothetical protein
MIESPFRRKSCVALWGAVILCGCPTEGTDPVEPTSILVSSWGDREASVELVLEGPHEFAASLPSLGVLVGGEDGLHRFDPAVDVPVLVSDDLELPSAVAELDDSTAAIATPEGLFVLDGESLRPSPLGELLVDWQVTAMLAAPRGESLDLWMASPSGLKLHRDGRLHDVAVGDLATAGAKLAWGPAVDGVPSLWVAAGADLYSITASGSTLTALPVVDGPAGPVEHMVSDAAGRLWAAGGDEFFRRSGDGVWQELVSPQPVSGLFGRPEDSSVFIVTDALLVADGEGFYAMQGVPDGSIAGIDSLGRLLVLGEAGLQRVSAGRPIGLIGLAPGDQLDDITAVALHPSLPDSVESIDTQLDGEPIALDAGWSLLLDPLELADGPHSLSISVTYVDTEEPVATEVLFSVGEFVAPTWTDDLEPLFDAECAECHTDSGVSRPLDTPASWQAELDLILYNLEEARMPLPPRDPLSLSEIQLVRAWAAGGFVE